MDLGHDVVSLQTDIRVDGAAYSPVRHACESCFAPPFFFLWARKPKVFTPIAFLENLENNKLPALDATYCLF